MIDHARFPADRVIGESTTLRELAEECSDHYAHHFTGRPGICETCVQIAEWFFERSEQLRKNSKKGK